MKNTPPPPSTIRLTIPVDSEVHSVFQRMAKAGNISTGRAMGGWLHDTVEAAAFIAATMEQARSSPKVVIRELQAYTLSVTDDLSKVMDLIKRKGVEDRAARRVAEGTRLRGGAAIPQLASIPPPCNTGGKVPKGNPYKGVTAKFKFPLPGAKVQASQLRPKASK